MNSKPSYDRDNHLSCPKSLICSNFEITYLCFIFILVVLIWWFCIWFYTLRRNFYIVVEPLFRSGVSKVVLRDDKRGRYRDGEKVLQMNGCLWRSSCNLRFGIKVVWVLWKQSRQNFCMIVHQACIIMQALPLVDVHSPKSFQTLFFPFLLPLILSLLSFPNFVLALLKLLPRYAIIGNIYYSWIVEKSFTNFKLSYNITKAAAAITRFIELGISKNLLNI